MLCMISEFANAALVIPKTLAVNAAKDGTVSVCVCLITELPTICAHKI